MKKIVKLCLLALTSILVLSLMTVSCFAAQPPTVMPLWDNILDIDLIIGIDGNSGTATATLSKQPGATKSDGTLTLYKQIGDNWIYVDSAYKSSTRGLAVNIDFYAESGVQYKAVFEGTAYRGDVGESHTITRYKTCP